MPLHFGVKRWLVPCRSHRSSPLNNLANLLSTRFEHQDNGEDLEFFACEPVYPGSTMLIGTHTVLNLTPALQLCRGLRTPKLVAEAQYRSTVHVQRSSITQYGYLLDPHTSPSFFEPCQFANAALGALSDTG